MSLNYRRTHTFMENFGTNLATEIAKQFDRKTAIVEDLSEALYLSKDAIYRRLRGETSFTFEEACAIANRFNLSLDAIAKSNGTQQTAFCSYNLYHQEDKSFKTFLEDMHQRFQYAANLPEVQMYYATKGLPLFLYLTKPELLAFKLFVWEVASWNAESIHDVQFDLDMLTEEDCAIAEQVYELYCDVPSFEIWNSTILESSFEQINYLNAINLFKDKNTPQRLYDLLRDLMRESHTMASKGRKIYKGEERAPLELFQSELFNATNNVIYITSEQQSFVSWTFCDPDYLLSYDEQLCQRAATWLKNLISQANNITKHSLRIRNAYFNDLDGKIAAASRTMETV